MFRRLRDARQGGVAIEFSIVAIPTLFMIGAIFTVGFYYFASESLDFSTRQAARKITVGAVPADVDTADELRDRLLCPNLFWAFDCSKIVVTSYRVGKTSDVLVKTGIYALLDPATKRLKTPVHAGRLCLGGPSDYVLLDVSYSFPIVMPKLLSPSTTGEWGMRSTAFIFNEPFTTPRDPGPC